MVDVNETIYLGHKAYEITNKTVSLLIVVDVGPRIISFGFCKKQNVLFSNGRDFLGDDKSSFINYGGHRLCIAPEDKIKTYIPDNDPCEVQVIDNGLIVTKLQEETNILFSMQIEMKENGRVRIIHTITNKGLQTIFASPCGKTQLAEGGIAVIPLDRNNDDIKPSRCLAFWDYTNLSDERIKFGRDFVYIKQDSNKNNPIKIGTFDSEGIFYYYIDGDLFTKEFDVSQGEYPDFGSNIELFDCDCLLEASSLGAMKLLKNGESVSHTEIWSMTEKTPSPSVFDCLEKEVEDIIHA